MGLVVVYLMVCIESTHVQLHFFSFDGVKTIDLVGKLGFEERENLSRAHRESRFLREKDGLATK